MHNAEAHKTPCEVCGKPSLWILSRRRNAFKGVTSDNPDAPRHPRCSAHSGADAYALDGREFTPSRPV